VALRYALKKIKEKGSLSSFSFFSFLFYLCADITTHFFFRHQLAHCILATSMNVCGQQTKVICKYNNRKKNPEICCLMKETKKLRRKEKLCVYVFLLLVSFLLRLTIERKICTSKDQRSD